MNGASTPSRGHQGELAGALVCTRCGSSVALDRSVLDLARAELVRTLGWVGWEPHRGRLELSGCCAGCRAGAGSRGWGRA